MAIKFFLRSTNGAQFIYVSDQMSGKMQGLFGVSSSVAHNELCKAHKSATMKTANGKKIESICAHCYADNYLQCKKEAAKCYAHNLKVLTAAVYPVSDFYGLAFGARVFRIESFGDVRNVTQALNYVNMSKANPGTNFGVWTKNPYIYIAAFKRAGKPKNMIFGYSSLFMNRNGFGAIREEYAHYFDFIFTVYSADYALFNAVKINCGGKKCATCDNSCYFSKNAAVKNECLKNDFGRYERAKKWIEDKKKMNYFIFRDKTNGELFAYVSSKDMRGIPGKVKQSELLFACRELKDGQDYKIHLCDLVVEMKRRGMKEIPHYNF